MRKFTSGVHIPYIMPSADHKYLHIDDLIIPRRHRADADIDSIGVAATGRLGQKGQRHCFVDGGEFVTGAGDLRDSLGLFEATLKAKGDNKQTVNDPHAWDSAASVVRWLEVGIFEPNPCPISSMYYPGAWRSMGVSW